MKKALVLGAGLVTRPLVRYLLDHDVRVTVASRTVSKAEKLVAGHANGKALALLADNRDELEHLVREHDLAISLLPAPMHPIVAEMCLKHGKHMVTTSYISPKMKELDAAACDKGLMLLNEIGVDPGIDHMSAMRVIHNVRERGGKVISFKSYCGGLPAPDDNDNPFGYKFSWSPRAVCTAGKNSALYRKDGKEVRVPGTDLFTDRHTLDIEGIGTLEAYPNRDSLGYIDIYGLTGIPTMFRGTFRYPGWCETLKAIVDLNLLDETPKTWPAGTTYTQFIASLLGGVNGSVRTATAKKLGLAESSPILDRMEWLGLFSDEPVPSAGKASTALDVLADLMLAKMPYKPGERDMIALCHFFRASFPGGKEEEITSTLIDFGIPNGDSSMARTVSLPAAIAARMILEGKIMSPGVHVPVTPDIYNPVLDELEKLKIRCVEKTKAL